MAPPLSSLPNDGGLASQDIADALGPSSLPGGGGGEAAGSYGPAAGAAGASWLNCLCVSRLGDSWYTDHKGAYVATYWAVLALRLC